jgi:hypothetical protein
MEIESRQPLALHKLALDENAVNCRSKRRQAVEKIRENLKNFRMFLFEKTIHFLPLFQICRKNVDFHLD